MVLKSISELFHEVHLKGGNGFNVMGRAFAGVPFVYAGRTDHMAWAMTTGTFGDNRDTYIETLCDGGYLSRRLPRLRRIEVIKVKGAPSVNLTVRRTVHGPVWAQGRVWSSARSASSGNARSSQRNNSWSLIARGTCKSSRQRSADWRSLTISLRRQRGNIAYWLSGKVPIRPAGFDPRLPLPGIGNAEWTGEFRPIPFAINPARGWLSSWNSKPSLGYPNPDQRSFGKQWRSLEIDERLAGGLISLNDMKDIAKDIARTDQGGDGREARYLKPYLLNALDVVPPSNALASQARAVLKTWDGSVFGDPIAATTREAGQVIFAKWLEVMRVNTFGDELGTGSARPAPICSSTSWMTRWAAARRSAQPRLLQWYESKHGDISGLRPGARRPGSERECVVDTPTGYRKFRHPSILRFQKWPPCSTRIAPHARASSS